MKTIKTTFKYKDSYLTVQIAPSLLDKRQGQSSKDIIYNTVDFQKKAHRAYKISLGFMRWGLRNLDWDDPSYEGLHPNQRTKPWCLERLQVIWTPFVLARNSTELREALILHKRRRAFILKVLSLSDDDRGRILQNPPSGVTNWDLIEIKNMQSWTSSQLRCWATAMFSTRSLSLDPKADFTTITNALKQGVSVVPWNHTRKFWKDLGVSQPFKEIPRKLRFSRFHLTTKMGPNGPALDTLFEDFISLKDLVNPLKEIGGEYLVDCLNTFEKLCFSEMILQPDLIIPPLSRRLGVFSDSETKTRIVGVIDYFSQSVLKPLHHWIFSILRSIPQDFTFNQDGFKEAMLGWGKVTLHSCDLKAATDRFPIQKIKEVLLQVLPESYVLAWESIMISRPFEYRGEYYSYSVGNPMGAYSSWATFALTHHALVYECCKELSITWSTAKYCLLGDDILFGDTRLYTLYKRKILDLGVEISEDKSFDSLTLSEFAKRLIYKGEEITPFPIPGVVAAKGEVSPMSTLLYEESRRGHNLTARYGDAVLEWVLTVHRVKGWPIPRRRVRKLLMAEADAISVLHDMMSGRARPFDLLNSISYLFNKKIDLNVADEFFSEFLGRTLKRNLVKWLRDEALPNRDWMNAIIISHKLKLGIDRNLDRLPWVNILIQIKEFNLWFEKNMNYKEARRRSYDATYLTFLLEEAPWVLKSIFLPRFDSVFRSENSEKIKTKMMGKFTKLLLKVLKTYESNKLPSTLGFDTSQFDWRTMFSPLDQINGRYHRDIFFGPHNASPHTEPIPEDSGYELPPPKRGDLYEEAKSSVLELLQRSQIPLIVKMKDNLENLHKTRGYITISYLQVASELFGIDAPYIPLEEFQMVAMKLLSKDYPLKVSLARKYLSSLQFVRKRKRRLLHSLELSRGPIRK